VDFGALTYAFAFVAGAASSLSPCVLPLLPILVASALSTHRLGAFALALGLAVSFATVGIFIATLGADAGLDPDTLRQAAAVQMILFGIVALSRHLQDAFTRMTSRASTAGHRLLGFVSGDGLIGQFAIGLLLGLVWSPCVGPTLGAASTLAAQGSKLGQTALLMMVFGLGAGMPLMLVGAVSRTTLMRLRGSLYTLGNATRTALGVLFVALGLMVLTGWDRLLETALVSASPAWLTRLTTALGHG
jgi:cytochrome c-type biogenesis protein